MRLARRHIGLRVTTLLIVLIVGVGAFIITRSPPVRLHWHAYRFRQAKQSKDWSAASLHLQRLINDDLLLGLERTELPALLGPPDEMGLLAPIVDCWLLDSDRRFLGEFNEQGTCCYAASADYDFTKLRNSSEPLIEAESGASRSYPELLTVPDDEAARAIGRPFPPARLLYLREMEHGNKGILAAMPFHLLVHSQDGLNFGAVSFGPPDGWGTLGTCVPVWFGLDSSGVEGAVHLLDLPFAADVAIRPEVPSERIADRMGEILTTLLQRPIRLTFREVERETLIVRGEFRRATDSQGPIVILSDPPQVGTIQTFTDSLSSIMRSVAHRMKLQLADDVANSRNIRVTYRSDFGSITPDQIDPILEYLHRETSLSFERQMRRVRILFVESGDN